MTSDKLKLTGRILYAVPFIIFGAYRFWSMDFFASMSPEWLPLPKLWIGMVGFGLIASSISIIIGKHTYLAGVMLAGMIITLASCVHIPNTIANWADPTQRSISMAMAVKDFVAAGGALFIAAAFKARKTAAANFQLAKEDIVYSTYKSQEARVSA